jgi:hypothetical protein
VFRFVVGVDFWQICFTRGAKTRSTAMGHRLAASTRLCQKIMPEAFGQVK